MENTSNATKLAILIDAENVVASHADLIFAQAEAMGEIAAKEIYGTAAALTAWVAPVLKYAIHPNLTIKAAKGKNSSDIALVIGAMDLLLYGGFDTIVIASSDSDFSALSVRLRNAGVNVVGMGTEKSNALWRTACSSFIVLEHPAPAAKSPAAPEAAPAPKAAAQPKKPAAKAAAQQPKKSAPAKEQAKQAASAHKERMSIIEQFIQKRLDSNGGRLLVNSLFTGLNKLPEYQTDRQGSGRKPLNYLSSTFAESFQFASGADGRTWISRMDTQPLPAGTEPAGEAPAEEAEPAVVTEAPVGKIEPAVEAEASVEAEAPVEAETLVEEAEAPVEDVEIPAVEPEAPVAEAASAPERSELAQRLVDGGMEPESADKIAPIFERTSNLRAAYNEIRRLFGNADGRALYHQAKEILDSRA